MLKTIGKFLLVVALLTGLGLFGAAGLLLPRAQFVLFIAGGLISIAPTIFVARMVMDLLKYDFWAVGKKFLVISIITGALSLGSIFIPQIVDSMKFLQEPVKSFTTWVNNAWNGVQNVQQGIDITTGSSKAGEVTYVYVLFRELKSGCTVNVTSTKINIRQTPNASSDNNIVQRDIVKGTPLSVVAESIVQNGEISWFMLPDKTFVRSDVVSKPSCSSV